MKTREAVFLLLLAVSAAAAQTKDPWKLPLEERIARRMEHQRAAMTRRAGPGTNTPSRPQFSIDGTKNPELFLPNELMASFLNTTDGEHEADRAAARLSFREAIQSFGWRESHFWRDLDSSAADFRRLARSAESDKGDVNWQKDACASRARALRAMRTLYPRFDEFLYRAVAPRRAIASDRLEDPEWLLWLDGGCQ